MLFKENKTNNEPNPTAIDYLLLNLVQGVAGIVLEAGAPHLAALVLQDPEGQVEGDRRRQGGRQRHQAVVQQDALNR